MGFAQNVDIKNNFLKLEKAKFDMVVHSVGKHLSILNYIFFTLLIHIKNPLTIELNYSKWKFINFIDISIENI